MRIDDVLQDAALLSAAVSIICPLPLWAVWISRWVQSLLNRVDDLWRGFCRKLVPNVYVYEPAELIECPPKRSRSNTEANLRINDFGV